MGTVCFHVVTQMCQFLVSSYNCVWIPGVQLEPKLGLGTRIYRSDAAMMARLKFSINPRLGRRLTLNSSFNALVRHKSVIRGQGGLMLQCDLDLKQLGFRTMCPGAQAPLRSEPSVWLSDNSFSRLCTLVALEMLRVEFTVLLCSGEAPCMENVFFPSPWGR